MAYPVLLLILLAAAFAFYVGSFGWVTGKPAPNARFMAAILAALLLVSAIGAIVSAKLECPILTADNWPEWRCFYVAIKQSLFHIGAGA